MYIPKPFEINSLREQIEFIQRNSFATVITVDDGAPVISHVPLICKEDKDTLILQGHFAKANPHTDLFESKKVIAISHGAHGYISPSWYANPEHVPTWNYMTVHCSGIGSLIEDQQWLKEFLIKLTDINESKYPTAHWKLDLEQNYIKNQLSAIIGFEIKVTQIEAKYKLNQNKKISDQESVVRALKNLGTDHAIEMAKVMNHLLKTKD